MKQLTEYKKLSPKEKERLSNKLAALSLLDVAQIGKDGFINPCQEGSPVHKEFDQIILLWKKRLLPDIALDQEPVISFFREAIKLCEWVLFIKSFSDFQCTFDLVKDVTDIYINAQKRLFLQNPRNDPDDNYTLTQYDYEKLKNSIIFSFYRTWLSYCPKMRQNIYEFAKAPFGQSLPLSELQKTTKNGDTFLDVRYKALCNARDDLKIIRKMRQIQENREGFQVRENPGRKTYTYTSLCAMEFIAESKMDDENCENEKHGKRGPDTSCFRIFKYICQRQHVFWTPSDKTSYQKIADACNDYASILDRIAMWGQVDENGKINDAKKYVIGTFTVTELEEAFRLHFVSASAANPQSKGQEKNETVRRKSEILLGRIPCKLPRIDFPAWNFLNYKSDIKEIYSSSGAEDNPHLDEVIVFRVLQINCHNLLMIMFFGQMQEAWDDSFFENVAEFIIKHYPIINSLRQIKFPSYGETEGAKQFCRNHYRQMRKIYSMTESMFGDGYSYYQDFCQARSEQIPGKK